MVSMKAKYSLLLFLLVLNYNINCDEISELLESYDYFQDITEELTYSLINPEYIYYIGLSGTLSSVSMSINFYPGVYELREQFNDIIENELFEKIKEKIAVSHLDIRTRYPFSVLLVNNNNYSFEETQRIRREMHTNGVFIENLFQNTIHGYIVDKYFGDLSQKLNEENNNSFSEFINKLNNYYGIGNFITFK
jgi:hypothetical protein